MVFWLALREQNIGASSKAPGCPLALCSHAFWAAWLLPAPELHHFCFSPSAMHCDLQDPDHLTVCTVTGSGIATGGGLSKCCKCHNAPWEVPLPLAIRTIPGSNSNIIYVKIQERRVCCIDPVAISAIKILQVYL